MTCVHRPAEQGKLERINQTMVYRQVWLEVSLWSSFSVACGTVLSSKSIWACAVGPSGAGQSSFPWPCVYSTWTSLLLASLPHLTHPVLEKGQLSHCCVGKINWFFIAGSQLTVEVTVAGCILHTTNFLDRGRWLWEPRSGVHLSQGFLVMYLNCAKLCELLSNGDDVFISLCQTSMSISSLFPSMFGEILLLVSSAPSSP